MARSEIVNSIMTAPHCCGSDGMWERGDAVEVAVGLAMAIDVTCGAGPVCDLAEYWIYGEESGTWSVIDKATLRGIAAGWAGEPIYAENKDGEVKPRALKVNNTKSYIDELEGLCAREGYGAGTFDAAPFGVAFADGFLAIDVDKGSVALVPKAPSHLQRFGYSFGYASDETELVAPLFERYISTLWDLDGDELSRRIMLVQEWMGLAILGLSTRYHRALVLRGKKGSGKSTFIDILKGLLPGGAANGEASVKPEQMGDDPFAYKLAFARINAVYEGEDKPIQNQARIREIISGEPITINIKYRPEPITTRITCAHIFAYNDLPSVPGAHAAFWDRFIVLDFDKSVRGTDAQVEQLAKKILAAERAALVRWCIDGALRALERGRYDIPASVDVLLREWAGEADGVSSWVGELTRPGEDEWTDSSLLYERYREWATKTGQHPVSQKVFSRRLRHIDNVLERKHPSTRRAQVNLVML